MATNRAGKYEIVVSYMKCLRNHASGSMAIVLDGCCEFAPGGQQGTPSFPFCAACGCHRHFHQRVEKLVPSAPPKNPIELNQIINDNSPIAALPVPPRRPYNLPQAEMEIVGEKKVIIRTKLSPEQKEVLRAFAERANWTIRNCGQEEIMQICSELGITRTILKNWINNNKKKIMAPAGQQAGGTDAQDQEVIVLQN